MGRLAVFIARQHADGAVSRRPAEVLGLGIDEGAALVIGSSGIGRLLRQADRGSVHILRAGPADSAGASAPLLYRAIAVLRLERPEEDQFDFRAWTGTGARFTLSVDGASSSPYLPTAPTSTPR